jgi:hypothetical protein
MQLACILLMRAPEFENTIKITSKQDAGQRPACWGRRSAVVGIARTRRPSGLPAGRSQGGPGIGAAQQLVQQLIRDGRLFALRHTMAPSAASYGPKHGNSDTPPRTRLLIEDQRAEWRELDRRIRAFDEEFALPRRTGILHPNALWR